MALATVSATLKGNKHGGKETATTSDTNLGNYRGLRTASVLRFLCVVNPSDTTSYASVKGNISVYHVQRRAVWQKRVQQV